jgi:CheY-like chemotaxis protein
VLDAEGVRVEVASDGVDALDRLPEPRPYVTVLDVLMPGRSSPDSPMQVAVAHPHSVIMSELVHPRE